MPAVLVTGYCYAELAISSLASTHFAYLWRDDQAELAWVARSNLVRQARLIQRWVTACGQVNHLSM